MNRFRGISSVSLCSLYKAMPNWPVKGLCVRCFICLRPPPLLWPHTPPLSHCIRVYGIHREGVGGELTREKVRVAIVYKAGRKYQHDWLYLQSVNSIKHQKRRHLVLGFLLLISPWCVHTVLNSSVGLGSPTFYPLYYLSEQMCGACVRVDVFLASSLDSYHPSHAGHPALIHQLAQRSEQTHLRASRDIF